MLRIFLKKVLIIALFLLLIGDFLNAQETSIGFITAPSITQKTTDELMLKSMELRLRARNTPSGTINFGTSFSHQTGVAYRISNKKWHFQSSLLFTQNSIKYGFENEQSQVSTVINTINPEIAFIRRFHFKNGIELNWQIGLNAGITLNSQRGFAKRGGSIQNPTDTTNYYWDLNFNAQSNKIRLAVQSSLNLVFPITDVYNFELGFGVFNELNNPNQWSYYQKTTNVNDPMFNSEYEVLSNNFNERMLFVKVGVFKKLSFKKKK